jgi:hypothetical protein
MPDSLQALPEKKALTKNVIAYEGVIKESIYPEFKGITPFAQGDGPLWAQGMPPETMFSVYGSGHVGIFGALIQPTNVERILRIDCTATDMFLPQKPYPTYLFYNPYGEAKTIATHVGDKAVDIYDAVSRTFFGKNVKGTVTVELPADAARLLVYVPTGSKFTVENGVLKADGTPIDYRYK